MEEPHAVDLSRIEISDFLIPTNGNNDNHNLTEDTNRWHNGLDIIAGLVQDLKSKAYDWKEVVHYNGITSRPYQLTVREEKTFIVDSGHGVIIVCNMNLKDPRDLDEVVNNLKYVKYTYGLRKPENPLPEPQTIDLPKIYSQSGLALSETFL